MHISELADDKVESPEEVVKVGEEIEVKVLRVDAKDRKIGLSRKDLYGGPASVADAQEEPENGPAKPAREKELRGGTGAGAGELFAMPRGTANGGGEADPAEGQ